MKRNSAKKETSPERFQLISISPTQQRASKSSTSRKLFRDAVSLSIINVCVLILQDNYTFAQPGIQKKVKALEELISRIDGEAAIFITLLLGVFQLNATKVSNNEVIVLESRISDSLILCESFC